MILAPGPVLVRVVGVSDGRVGVSETGASVRHSVGLANVPGADGNTITTGS